MNKNKQFKEYPGEEHKEHYELSNEKMQFLVTLRSGYGEVPNLSLFAVLDSS